MKRIILIVTALIFALLALYLTKTPVGPPYPEETNTACSDGYDNNHNGLIDCEDSSCFGKEVCL